MNLSIWVDALINIINKASVMVTHTDVRFGRNTVKTLFTMLNTEEYKETLSSSLTHRNRFDKEKIFT